MPDAPKLFPERKALAPEVREAIRRHVDAHPLALWDGARFHDAVGRLAALFGRESADDIARSIREHIGEARRRPGKSKE